MRTLPSLGDLLNQTKKREMMKLWDGIEGNNIKDPDCHTQQHRRNFIRFSLKNYTPALVAHTVSSTYSGTRCLTATERKHILRISGSIAVRSRSGSGSGSGSAPSVAGVACEGTAYIDTPITTRPTRLDYTPLPDYMCNGNRLLMDWKGECENRRSPNL